MRLAYFEPVDSALLEPWFILEAVLLLLNVFIYVIWIIIVLKAHLHINLKIIATWGLLQYIPCIFARSLLLAYQAQIIHPISHPNSSSVLIILSLIRMNMLVLCMCFPLWLFFERQMAMLYIRDYEKRPRIWISFYIIIFANFYVWINIFCLTYEWVHWTILAGFTLLMGFVGTVLFCYLEKKAKRMQEEVGKVGKKSVLDYSLSLRFQLEENLWSCKLIKNTILLFCVINATGTGAYVAANLELTKTLLTPETVQLLDCFWNIGVSINGPLIAVGTVVYNDYLVKLIKTTFFGSNGKLEDPFDSGERYFENLQKMWNFDEPKGQRIRKNGVPAH